MKSSKKIMKIYFHFGKSGHTSTISKSHPQKKISQRVGRGKAYSCFIERVCTHDVFPGKTLKLAKNEKIQEKKDKPNSQFCHVVKVSKMDLSKNFPE